MAVPRVVEEREEGGTPDILGSIRLGLVFSMKGKLGSVEVLLYCKGHRSRNVLFPDFPLHCFKQVVKWRELSKSGNVTESNNIGPLVVILSAKPQTGGKNRKLGKFRT